MPAPGPAPIDVPNPFTGILLKVASVCVFMGLSSSVKALGDEIPTAEVLFFRSFFALPPIVIWLALRGEFPSGLRTPRPMGHVWRSLAGVASMATSFYALTLLPLTDVVAILYAGPLFLTVFAAIFLGERIRAYRIASVGLGFAGVLLVMTPRLMADDGAAGAADAAEAGVQALGAMMALASAVTAGLAQTFVRGMSKVETTAAIVFWFTTASTVIGALALPFFWVTPDARQWLLLMAGGLSGGIGQIMLTSSYRYAEAGVIAPFEYVSMLLAVALGWYLFDEAPTLVVVAGAALVTLGGILVIWRERQLGIERRASRAVRPPPVG